MSQEIEHDVVIVDGAECPVTVVQSGRLYTVTVLLPDGRRVVRPGFDLNRVRAAAWFGAKRVWAATR